MFTNIIFIYIRGNLCNSIEMLIMTIFSEDNRMVLPNLAISDVVSLVPLASDVLSPLDGGQKLVFPCTLEGRKCALLYILLSDDPSLFDGSDLEDEKQLADILDEEFARAKREIDIIGKCCSPHLVKLGPLDAQIIVYNNQLVFQFSEEWVEGDNLKSLISRDGALAIKDVVLMGIQLTSAIDELWSYSQVHRDIKPGNIMYHSESRIFTLLDMGMAFDLEDKSITAAGFAPGTLPYMSPEQILYVQNGTKRLLDFRSDLYSLGVVLYECLTGAHPYCSARMNRTAIINAILNTSPPPPSSKRQEIPPELDKIVLRLLGKEPHLRFRSCSLLVDALSPLVGRD